MRYLHAVSQYDFFTGRILLMKYYNFLLSSFPRDHLISFDRLNKAVPIKDSEIVSTIVSSSDSKKTNRLILNITLNVIDKDQDLREFYLLVDRIIDNPKLSKILNVFRNGMFINNDIYICSFRDILYFRVQ